MYYLHFKLKYIVIIEDTLISKTLKNCINFYIVVQYDSCKLA